MFVESIEIIASIAFSVFIGFLSFIITKSKNAKVKQAASVVLTITNEVKTHMLEAEKYKNYTGKEKLEYVLSRMQTYLANKKLSYDEDMIKNIVESEISLTKNVNAREKDISIPINI